MNELIIKSFLRNRLSAQLFSHFSRFLRVPFLRLNLCRVDLSLVLHIFLILISLLLGSLLIASALCLVHHLELELNKVIQ